MRLFHIICSSRNSLNIGEKLILDDPIERGDYKELDKKMDTIDWRFNEELKSSLDFHERVKNNIDDYKKDYLIITNNKNIIKSIIRI